MYGISTITQKGQVVIPAAIREALGLKPATRVSFEVRNPEQREIVVKPALTIDEAFGMIKTTRVIPKREWKKAVRDAVVEKYLKKNT